MAKDIEVTIPDIGDFHDVPVIDVLVKTGDSVEKDAPLLTLESDKATIDVPAPEAGIVGTLSIKVGDKVSKGAPVMTLQTGNAEAPKAASAPAAAPPPKAEAPKPAKPAEAPALAAAAAKATPASAPSTIKVTIPDVGDFKDIPVIEILVAEGDSVAKDAPLLTLESDKATMEVPAPAAGVVRGIKLKVGDRVSKGAAVCDLEVAGAAAPAAAPASAPPPVAEKATPAVAEPPPATRKAEPTEPPIEMRGPAEVPYASPSIRKFARELGVNLLKVTGTGPKSRITREDVQGFVKKTLQAPPPAPAAAQGSGIPPIPAVDFSQFGEVETLPLARIRKLSAAHLHRAWLNIPHVTQTDEADITELEAFRKSQSDDPDLLKAGIKLTLLPFVLKACSKAMESYPEFAASLTPDGDGLVMKKYRHIGFAADTPNGLVVPVIRDVDKKGIAVLAKECAELAKKAREGKLKPDEMRGGVFSISSLGGIGGSHFTPIVNAPEVGILGVSKSVMKPVWDGKQFMPRLMCPLSLSYDHRVIDGAYAARFIVLLVKLLGDVRRLSL